MAETRRTKARKEADSPAVATLDPPDVNPKEPEPSPPEPARPLKSRQLTFFQQMGKINTADWGTRAKVTLYRLEPLIDQLRAGNVKYINVYHEPVDEQRIKLDYGSGRYRLMLTFAKPGLQKSDTVDAIEFDILDQTYPPKIPEGTWIDDPRNGKWAWAKRFFKGTEPEKPQQPGLLETLQVLNDIQDSTAERMKANTPPPAPTATPDPAFNAFTMAKEMLAITKGGGDTTLLEMFRDELKAAREENKLLQADFRKLTMTPPPPPPAPVDAIDVLSNSLEKFEKIKKVLSPETKSGESIINERMRSKMSGWQEFAVNIAEKAFESPVLGNVLGMITQNLFARSMNGPAALPAPGLPMNGTIPNPAQPPDQMRQVIDFMNAISAPMLNMFGEEMDGGDFAEWLYEGHGETWIHPAGVPVPWYSGTKQIGVANLLKLYQQSPYWAKLKDHAPRFEKFLGEFVAWQIPKNIDPESDGPEVIDFEDQGLTQ